MCVSAICGKASVTPAGSSWRAALRVRLCPQLDALVLVTVLTGAQNTSSFSANVFAHRDPRSNFETTGSGTESLRKFGACSAAVRQQRRGRAGASSDRPGSSLNSGLCYKETRTEGRHPQAAPAAAPARCLLTACALPVRLVFTDSFEPLPRGLLPPCRGNLAEEVTQTVTPTTPSARRPPPRGLCKSERRAALF